MIEDGPEGAEALPLEERLSDAALAAMLGDPYEVGLRLALEDGVAAALPAVARELAVLERAVGVVQGGLAGLAVAPAAWVPPVPVVGAPGAVAAPEPARATAGPATPVPVSRGTAAPPVSEMPTVLRAAERVAAEVLPQVAPVPPALALPESKSAAVGWQNTEWAGLAAVPGLAAPPVAVLPAPGAAPVAMPGEAAPQEGRLADAWPGLGMRGGTPSAAPPALPPALLSPPDFAEPAQPAAPAEADDAAEERAMQGVLEIDGARLGRFVAEHLGREAGRPPSGMTGFDPLLSPQWPGALQG